MKNKTQKTKRFKKHSDPLSDAFAPHQPINDLPPKAEDFIFAYRGDIEKPSGYEGHTGIVDGVHDLDIAVPSYD